MDRRRLTLGALTLVLVVGGVAIYYWQEAEEEARVAEQAARREATEARRERREDERWRTIREESEELIPPLLRGVHLGMSLANARGLRRGMQANTATSNLQEPDMTFMAERLGNGAGVVYGFERESQRLQRLQVQSILPNPEAIAPHLTAMNETYGAPTGIWDCPNTGGVPTRRFTWRHGQTTVSDIFLIYGGRVSVTLYIAPTNIIMRSLRMASCRPVRNQAEAAAFPVTTPEALNRQPGSSPAP